MHKKNSPVHWGALSILFLFAATPVAAQLRVTVFPSFKEHTFEFGGYERSFWLYQPANRTFKNQRVPVVFVLHGGGGSARNMSGFTKGHFNKLANRDGFLVVYPQGYESHWNDGRDPEVHEAIAKYKCWSEDFDDVGFLIEILNKLMTRYDLDLTKVFTCGISNGGFMSNRLACERPDIFKGAGIITASMDKSYADQCNPDKPVGIIVFNGTEDTLVPYDGGALTIKGETRLDVISTDDYIQFWANHNQCSEAEPTMQLPDQDHDDGTTVSVTEYAGCADGGPVVLYTIHGGGHTWPGGQDRTMVTRLMETVVGQTSHEINAIEVMWDFFKSL